MVVKGDEESREAGKGYIEKFVIASGWVGGGGLGGWELGLFCSARTGLRKDLICISFLLATSFSRYK